MYIVFSTVAHTEDYVRDKALELPVIISDTNALYLHGLGLIAQQSGVDTSYYHPDGLGSIRNLTNSAGQVIVGYSYDALRSSSGTLTNDFRFTGRQVDPETGSYYLRARHYDPGTGRFVTRDPFPGHVLNPDSLHRYAYVQNNPMNLVDPSGLDTSGRGFFGSFGIPGFGGSGSLLLVWDTEWNIGVIVSGGPMGVTMPTASIGLGGQETNAKSICSLTSPTVFAGISAGEGFGGGADVVVGTNEDGSIYHGAELWVGVTAKAPLPWEFHGGFQAGWMPLRVNLRELAWKGAELLVQAYMTSYR